MTKLTLIPLAGLAIMLALLVGACGPNASPPPSASTGPRPASAARDTCASIHHYISAGTLDTHEAETVIKLAAAKDGVPDSIRGAIDSYYRGDHAAGRQAMLIACADAGYPQ